MATESPISREQIIAAICAETSEEFSSKIDNNVDFADIPMDSLDIMSAFQGVEDVCNVKILDEDMHRLRKLSDLVTYLRQQNVVID